MQETDLDYHNFSTPVSSSHRLPTLSGTQAIRYAVENSRPLASGLDGLDAILATTAKVGQLNAADGGFRRGVVTEIFGPPGVGKTTLALQTAVNTMVRDKAKVTWIDTSSPLIISRLRQVLRGVLCAESDPDEDRDELNARLVEHIDYLDITSLPKLLALFLHPVAGFPADGTSLVVVEDLSNLVLSSLPRKVRQSASSVGQTTPSQIRNDHANRQALARRTQVISSLASALQAFAAAKNVALLVTCKASINLKGGRQAFLKPSLSTRQWDTYVGVTIALFRDFWPTRTLPPSHTDDETELPAELERRTFRYAQVVKIAGREVSSNEIGFVIKERGIREVTSLLASGPPPILPAVVTGLAVTDADDILAEAAMQDDGHMLENEQSNVMSDSDVDDSILPQPLLVKRKATEMADRDDEAMIQPTADTKQALVTINAMTQALGTQVKSSQPLPAFQTAKKLRIEEAGTDHLNSIGKSNNPMHGASGPRLIDDEIEAGIPAFSQAAAEMSDPLTPSDDGGRSP